MLVVISDLHLTDGTSGETINDKAFRIFRNRISDMAYDASWRKQKGEHECAADYRPIEQMDILLLGDILDMIRSEKWNHDKDDEMPWANKRDNEFYTQLEKIVDGILEEPKNKRSFEILKGFTQGKFKIPKEMREADAGQQSEEKIRFVASDEKVAVKVNIYYMVGNHDWFFYINDHRMDRIRNKVIDALGLANTRNKPFPFSPNECEMVNKLQADHRVYALHGDKFDEMNFTKPTRDGSSKGDAVVIKILNQIPDKVGRKLKALNGTVGEEKEVNKFVAKLRELDNLRPYTLAPAWIMQEVKACRLNEATVNHVVGEVFSDVLSEYAKSPMVKSDLKLKIELNLASKAFGSFFNLEFLKKVIDIFDGDDDRAESYKDHARTIAEDHTISDRDFYMMGHTHYPEIVPLATYIDKNEKKRHNKIYINTGTWRALHKTGIMDKSFVSYKTMTISAFFKEDERGGRPFEYWVGSLAL